jgi:glycerol transport system ATP-binding protein
MDCVLVKKTGIVLFDEHLLNLDYKLSKEPRSELKALFKTREIIAIYTTSEAHETLALGGTNTLLHLRLSVADWQGAGAVC